MMLLLDCCCTTFPHILLNLYGFIILNKLLHFLVKWNPNQTNCCIVYILCTKLCTCTTVAFWSAFYRYAIHRHIKLHITTYEFSTLRSEIFTIFFFHFLLPAHCNVPRMRHMKFCCILQCWLFFYLLTIWNFCMIYDFHGILWWDNIFFPLSPQQKLFNNSNKNVNLFMVFYYYLCY